MDSWREQAPLFRGVLRGGLSTPLRGRSERREDGLHGHTARRDIFRRPRLVRSRPGAFGCAQVDEGGMECVLTVRVAVRRVDLKKQPGYTNIAAVYPDMSFGWLIGWCVVSDQAIAPPFY